jgi:hypothetical protein
VDIFPRSETKVRSLVDLQLSQIRLRPVADILLSFERKVRSLVNIPLSPITFRPVLNILSRFKKGKVTGGHTTFSNKVKASCGHIITF